MLGKADNVGGIEYDARIVTKQLKEDAAEADRIAKNAGESLATHTEKGSNRAGEALKKFGKVAAVALAATGAAAIAFGATSTKAFIESQNAIAQTEAVLKSTKGQAGVTAEAVTDLANSLQRQTRYSDESIRSAENMLLTFTNISNKTFPGATEAVLDMATAMGSDLQSTAVLVGKALQDPVRGATALTRVGVRLSDSQIDLIKKFTASGKAAEAQAIILKELQVEFGGSAKAAGETFAGRLDILKNQLGEVQEGIGEIIVRGITPLVTGFLQWFDAAGGVEGVMSALITPIKAMVSAFEEGDVTSNGFIGFMERIGAIAKAVFEYLMPKLDALWGNIKEITPTLIQFTKEILAPIAEFFGVLLVAAIGFGIDAINLFLEILRPVIDFVTNNKEPFLLLAGAVTAIWTAMKVTEGINAFILGMNTLKLITIPSMMTTLSALGAAFVAAIPVLAIATAIALAINEINKLNKALEESDRKVASSLDSTDAALRKANEQYKAGKISKERYNAIIKDAYANNADGTNNWRGGPTWVNEEGPEIIDLPRGTRIIPNELSEKMMRGGGGGSVSVIVHMKGIMSRSKSDEREIARGLIQRVNEELKAKHLEPIGGGAI